MAFYETPRFPETIGIGAEGGPEYLTEIIETISGWEQRNAIMSQPRQRYTVSFVNRPTSELADLLAFFRVVKGRAHGFRFKDLLDYQTSATEGILTSIAGSPSGYFQMYKRYTSGSSTDDRKITKPVSGTVNVYQNGTVTGSGWSIDHTTGIVYAPGLTGTLTWSGEFDVPVRFDTDRMAPSYVPISGSEKLGTWDSIDLIELRT